ncbi:MAG: hypothetical protein EOP34_11770 [Rickettsiales bacterium]|nr:MAG: hypothetical protein EOP34_11770 [Rickettsiales bacterium]
MINDVTKYKNAVKLFEERYGALPGDVKASTIWTGASDGNEDTRIGLGTGNIIDITGEPTYAWQHLQLAQILTINKNLALPASKIDGTYFLFYDHPTNSTMYNRIGTYLSLSGIISSLPFYSGVNRVTATAIDSKIDDGIASSGMVYSTRGDDKDKTCSGNNCKCVTNYWDSSISTNYIFTDETVSCRMIFWLNEIN